MKKLFFVVFLSVAIAMQAQQHLVLIPEAFSGITVTGKLEVELIHSDKNLVEIRQTEGLKPEEIKVKVSNGILHIKTSFSGKNKAQLIVYYASVLTDIRSNAGADIRSPNTLETPSLLLAVRAGGKVECTLKVQTLDAKLVSGGLMVLKGYAHKQTVQANTGSTYSAYELQTTISEVICNVGAKAKIQVSETLIARAFGKSFIGYDGNPASLSVKEATGGKVEKVQ